MQITIDELCDELIEKIEKFRRDCHMNPELPSSVIVAMSDDINKEILTKVVIEI